MIFSNQIFYTNQYTVFDPYRKMLFVVNNGNENKLLLHSGIFMKMI